MVPERFQKLRSVFYMYFDPEGIYLFLLRLDNEGVCIDVHRGKTVVLIFLSKLV